MNAGYGFGYGMPGMPNMSVPGYGAWDGQDWGNGGWGNGGWGNGGWGNGWGNGNWGNGNWGNESYDTSDPRNARYGEAYAGYNGGYPIGQNGPPQQYGQAQPGYSQPPLGFGPQPAGPPRPPQPRPPMFSRRGKSGTKGFEERACRYLIKCGLAKEFVMKIPKEILLMMEPTHCGLCSFSFNAFALSRVHYNSKGHLNAQKKWVQQRSNMGSSKTKELPMKSRELYCELCDVQITSKVHGDSHYSGKPHRAIVEGRKVPKNPMLLQPGSEARLEQLIRREKKAYLKKSDEDTADESEETSVLKADSKPMVPELYCEICKTFVAMSLRRCCVCQCFLGTHSSDIAAKVQTKKYNNSTVVTCSEQMTMHMNGKKHLSKEKQHILKMMKGESVDDIADEYEEEEDEGDAKAEEFGANGVTTGAMGGEVGANGGESGVNYPADWHQ